MYLFDSFLGAWGPDVTVKQTPPPKRSTVLLTLHRRRQQIGDGAKEHLNLQLLKSQLLPSWRVFKYTENLPTMEYTLKYTWVLMIHSG